MSTIEFSWVGWCSEDGHDKVWGVFNHEGKGHFGDPCFVFWAKRGGSISFKKTTYDRDLQKLVANKKKKGYNGMKPDKMLEVWPNFNTELERKLCFSILSNRIQ